VTSLGFGARLTGAAETSMGATRAAMVDTEGRMMDFSNVLSKQRESLLEESRESLKNKRMTRGATGQPREYLHPKGTLDSRYFLKKQ
jgi:hypothetical protein